LGVLLSLIYGVIYCNDWTSLVQCEFFKDCSNVLGLIVRRLGCLLKNGVGGDREPDREWHRNSEVGQCRDRCPVFFWKGVTEALCLKTAYRICVVLGC